MSVENDKRLYQRVYHFPDRIEAARERLRKLEAESRNLGLKDCTRNLEAVNEAWDRIIEKEQLKAVLRGSESTMGVEDV